MAQQLIQQRTPQAYAGVQHYARSHTGEAAAAAYMALGQAYVEDGKFKEAASSFQLANHYGQALDDYAVVDLVLPGNAKLAPHLSFGGSLFLSSGSRPTAYYQPLARLSLPLRKGLAWKSEYRYYGYNETFYQYEGFRAHLFQTGVTLSLAERP